LSAPRVVSAETLETGEGGAEVVQSPVDESVSDEERAEILTTIAWLRWQEGQFEEAARLLVEAIGLDDEAERHYNLGRCYQELGRWTEARDAYRAYLARDPSSGARERVESRIETLERQIREDAANQADEPGSTTEEERPSQPISPRRVQPWPWVVLGFGVASLSVGAVLGGLYLRDIGTAEDADVPQIDGIEAYERARTYHPVALSTLSVGCIIAAAGLVWGLIDLITARRHPSPATIGLTLLPATGGGRPRPAPFPPCC
jgi:tetratricopeptide (TPR) repeat protein